MVDSMRKHALFSIINLILFITCNILINYLTGWQNILITVFFYITWSFALIGVYFMLHEYANTLEEDNLFFSKRSAEKYYLSYKVCIVLLLLGVVCFIAWFYFNKFGAIQYEMFTLINGVILSSQILVRVLIDLNIIRFRFE